MDAAPVVGFGGAVEAQVGDGAQVEVVLDHVKRACHLAEQQHPVPCTHACIFHILYTTTCIASC